MSDDEAYDEDDTGLSESSEPELDEIDQNDDVDAGELVGVLDIDEEDDQDMIYGPLRPLKMRDGDHINIVVVPNVDRITSNFISLPEFTEATGIRASQIERGSHIFTDVTGMADPIKMAHKEFRDRKNPLILERVIETNGNIVYVEHWKVRDMTYSS